MTSRYLTLLLFFSLFLFGCQQNNKQQYIYIGHSYDWQALDGNRIDPRIEALDLARYDQIWLGGDICGRSSEKRSTLVYLDELFGLGKSTTLWALGNHDLKQGHPEYISEQTKRPFSYSYSSDGITTLVLNTNLGHPQSPPLDSSALCEQLNNQFTTLKNIADTITSSAYLVILHHHGLITKELVDGRKDLLDKWHYLAPRLPFSCSPPGTFEELAYPLLTTIQRKGIQVILVGGDIGQRAKTFEYQNNDGIWFLGSGINNSMGTTHVPKYVTNLNPDSILVFEYDVGERELSWRFLGL